MHTLPAHRANKCDRVEHTACFSFIFLFRSPSTPTSIATSGSVNEKFEMSSPGLAKNEDDIITAERTVSAISWLRQFLNETCSPAEAARQTANIQKTKTTVQTIESIRDIIQKQTEVSQLKQKQHNEQIAALNTARETWERSGGNLLREQLDPDAIAETDSLAQICATLNLTPTQALSKGRRIAALTQVVDEYFAAEHRVARRRYALADAQQALRDAADELQNGCEAVNDVTNDIEKRTVIAEGDRARTEIMRTKAAQYESAEKSLRKKIQKSGVNPSTTHDQVAKDGERLRELENELADVKQELIKYHDLPPVR